MSGRNVLMKAIKSLGDKRENFIFRKKKMIACLLETVPGDITRIEGDRIKG